MQSVLGCWCLSRRISSKESFNFPSLEGMGTDCPPPNHMRRQERSSFPRVTISPVPSVLCWVLHLGLTQAIWHKPSALLVFKMRV